MASIHDTAAELLLRARTGKQRMVRLPGDCRPGDESAAYEIQRSLAGKLAEHYGGSPAGYKIACTNETAQKQLGVDGPFCGRLLHPFVRAYTGAPVEWDPSEFFMRVIEPEFGYRIGRDMDPSRAPFTTADVLSHVDAALPAFEIVDSRYDDWTTAGALALISDNACNGAWVQGVPVEGCQLRDLAAQRVTLHVNGEQVREGSGAAVLGNPLNALTWLANKLAARGDALQAGQFVTTGVVCAVYFAEPGDLLEADFGPIGKVALRFS